MELKLNFLLLCTLLSLSLLKAQIPGKKEKKHPIFIGLFFSGGVERIYYPDHFYDPFKIKPRSPFILDGKNTTTDFKIGLDLKIKLNAQLSISTGAVLVRDKEFLAIPILPDHGVQLTHKYLRTGIPLRLDIKAGKKQLSPLLTFGAIPSIKLRQTTQTDYTYKGKITTSFTDHTDDPDYKFENQFLVGFGLDAELKSIKLQLFPMYEFSFRKSHTNMFNHALSFGLSASFRI